MKTIPFFLVLGLIFSCQEAKTPEKKQVAKNTASIPVRANAQIDLNVEGMVCQMGCGGSMRKELKNAGGVERVEVNFVEGEKTQLVQVSYDSLLISSNKIASILNTINDKQITAKVVSKKSISVGIKQLKIAFNGDTASAKFQQIYASDNFKGNIRKTLDMVRQGNTWLIVRESVN